MKRTFTKHVFMRASVMLLMTLLTSIGAWAQASMLMTDTEEPLGSAARHYVLMSVNTLQEFVIPTDGSGRPVDGNGNLLRSFKLYDDGGKGGSSNWTSDLNYPGNYNTNYYSGIQITAPEGYRLYINGVAHLAKAYSVSHRGEYRDDYKNVANEEDKFTTWYGTHSFNESSTGKSITFWLTPSPSGGINYSDNGFDLTITVFKDNETYNVNTSSASHGTVTTNKATAKFMEQVNMTIIPDAYYESTSTHSYIGNDNTSVNVSSSPHFFMMPNSDVTFPNMFKPIDYTINYTNDDGTSAANGQNGMTNANPTTYNVETPDITLVAPKRFGYTFAGWYNNAECTGDAITGVALPVGSHDNQTFYAKWTQNSGTTETITSETAEATINDNITVTGTGGDNTRLKIAAGATVTIKDLTISVLDNGTEAKWPGIECLGDATIILDGTDNSITINGSRDAGIFVPSDKTLTIQEVSTGGTLNITSAGTGIGSNLYKDNCGNIIINGGTINIVSNSVAIGANGTQACGDITINGGTVSVQGAATGIGSSRYGSCGNITIANTVNSVTVTGGIKGSNSVTIGGVSTGNISFSPYVYNPSAGPFTITFDKGTGSGTMETQTYYSGIPQNLNLSTFTAPDDHFFYNWSTESGGGGDTYLDGQLILPTANMTLYAQYVPATMTLTSSTGSVRLVNGMTLTGTGGKNTSVSIADGATVTFNNVTIPNVNDGNDRYYAVQCEGNATIFFEGTNEVDNSSRDNYPALFVPENKTLTIIGTGSLTAKGGKYAPGIGSRLSANGGHIVINSGTVTAIGGNYCAGIGSSQSPCGDITIANTVTCVTATAGSGAPNAIGSTNHWTYSYTSSTSGTCGTIYIGYLLYDEISGSTHTLRPQIAVSLADNADNTDALDDAHNKFSMVTLNGRTIYRDGDWNTLTLPFPMTAEQIAASPLAGATIKELATSSKLDADGKLTLNFETAYDPTVAPTGSIEAGKPYIVKWTPAAPDLTISTATEWDAFASKVTNGEDFYDGKLVKLAADISVTKMVGTGGSSGKRFKGTFDGAGHTLTFNSDVNETYLAPFRAVEGATIKNLHVVGTITTSHTLAAGLISGAYGNCTISKCRSSVIITSSWSGDAGNHGGFIGQAYNGSSITLNNCLFDGQLLGSSTNGCGGFVGFREYNGSLTFTNCLFNPSAVTIGTGYSSSTFACNGSTKTSLERCYYKTAFGIAQGKQTNATGDDLVAQLGDGWENNSGNVVPKMDAIIVNNPVFRGVTIDKTAPTAVSFTNNASTGDCQFVGNYSPFTIDDSNIKSVILLGSNNKLGYSSTNPRTLRCFRAHFFVPSKPDGGSSVRSFELNFGEDGGTTGVFQIENGELKVKTLNSGWYTLGGLKLQGEPTEKGVYIYNGKKVVLK